MQAIEEYRMLKHKKEVEWATKIIQRHYIQWKVGVVYLLVAVVS